MRYLKGRYELALKFFEVGNSRGKWRSVRCDGANLGTLVSRWRKENNLLFGIVYKLPNQSGNNKRLYEVAYFDKKKTIDKRPR